MDLRSDLRDAWRLARGEPGFAAIAIFTMALGVGAATTLFSLVNGVLLRPLPWHDADRLVRVSETRKGATRNFPGALTNGTFLAWAEKPATIDGLAAWTSDKVTLTSSGGAPERIDVVAVTPSLFPMLRAEAIAGAVFKPGDEQEGHQPVVVLSHALWQQRFASDPHIVGKLVRLDGEATTVVGVMPAGFEFPNATARAWTPFLIRGVAGKVPGSTNVQLFQAMAKLRPGVTVAQAASEGSARTAQAPALNMVGMAVFGTKSPAELQVVPALEAMTSEVRQPLLLFLAAVGLLVLTATANIASLQLVRAAARRRDTAIRSALGAGAGRLARPMIVESVALGVLGGTAGLALAAGLHRVLPAVMPPRFPRLDAVHIDPTVALFATGVSLASAVVFGVIPSFLGSRVDLVSVLNEDGLAPAGGGARTATSRARRAIIVGQVAIASVLLIGGLLLAQSFVRLLQAERGYDPVNVLTAQITLPDTTYDGARRMALLDRTLERLRAMPGVTAAAAGTTPPFSQREMLTAFTMPASGDGKAPAEVHAAKRHVSDGWFASLGIRVIAGRTFNGSDARTSRPVVVVNRTFARTYLGDRPLGRLLPLGDGKGEDENWEVIGVVDDVRQRDINERLQPEIYADYRQLPKGFNASEATFVLRTAADPSTFADTLRRLVHDQDSSLAFDSIVTLEDRLRDSLAEPRLYALLLAAFAVSALIVAGVGLFAVLSYSVTQRAREIGVRTAIGARPIDIVRLVLSQALGMAAVGVALGLLMATAAVRVLSGFLYGIGPYDPVTLVSAVVLLLTVALMAAVIPARRAARVDPISVIRS
jgi:putative ABC transport system permease protein